MEISILPADMGAMDLAALALFGVAWMGYGPLIRSVGMTASITSRLQEVREAWMERMLDRDNRITDASLLGHTLHSATFFAGTAMISIAALLGVFCNFDRTFSGLHELAFTAKTSHDLAEGKLLLLALVLAHAFLKFTWSIRQINYTLALVGAAPIRPSEEERAGIASGIAASLSSAVSSLNSGMRDYYHAFALLAWFVGPLPSILATLGVVGMLLWRQFASDAACSMRRSHEVLSRASIAARSA